jgi:hypothetical protein
MSNPIFVVGTPRSGTTLLANILDRHPHISVYYESKFWKTLDNLKITNVLNKIDDIDCIISQIQNLDIAGLSPRDVKYRFLGTDQSYMSLFDSILKMRMERNGKSRYGEKTPTHFLYLDKIFQCYPDAKIVCAVRDPREICTSYKYNRMVVNKTWNLNDVVIKSLFWNLYQRRITHYRNTQYSRQITSVKFESLVDNPEYTTKVICAFLEELYHEDMLAVDGTNSSFRELRNKQGIRKEVIKRPRYLTKLEIFFIELICSKYMLGNGYELITQGVKTSSIMDRLHLYSSIDWCYHTLRNKKHLIQRTE